MSLVRNYGCSYILRIFINNYATKWILCEADVVNKSTSTVEIQNIPTLLKLNEGMNQNTMAIIRIYQYKSVACKIWKMEKFCK